MSASLLVNTTHLKHPGMTQSRSDAESTYTNNVTLQKCAVIDSVEDYIS